MEAAREEGEKKALKGPIRDDRSGSQHTYPQKLSRPERSGRIYSRFLNFL